MAASRRPIVSGLAGLALLLPAAAVPPAAAAAASTTAQSQTQTQDQIALAFRGLSTLPTVARGRATLQGYDAAMRSALTQAGDTLLSSDGGRTPTVTETIGTVTVVRPNEATVPVSIHVTTKAPPPSYSVDYRGVALRVHGRWQVSWTTMCLLVESSSRGLCPPAPAHTVAGDIVPSSVAPPATFSPTPGLVSPGPLAMAPDGGVLIADRGRNQILEWKDGALTVVAGDGLQGFTGDGGPAPLAELNGPQEIAVGRHGTVYFVDQGNGRVRAISPQGSITTVAGDGGTGIDGGDGGRATAATLNPSGVAVGPSGALYISSNSDIRVVAPDGIISTLVRGGPPYGVDVQVGGAPIAFEPGSLAINGQGDLIVFSFSPKALYSVSPTGQVTQVAEDYVTALSPAPDGSVLVAQHAVGLSRVTGTTDAPITLANADLPGDRDPLVAEGIAEAPSGVTYVDTEYGDGFSDQSALFSMDGGVVQPVSVNSSLVSTLPGPGAPGFPSAAYPPPVPATGPDAAPPSCPSPQGVVPFSPQAEASAAQLLGFWNSGFSYDLHASDRSWWPAVVANFAGPGIEGRQTVGLSSPAAASLYAQAIAAACGPALVRDSLEFVLGPSAYDFSYQHVFVLDRDGTPLVYFAVP